MKIVTFGSTVVDTAIWRNKDSRIDNELRIYGISPFSLKSEETPCDIIIDWVYEKNTYRQNIVLIDLNKKLKEKIQGKKWDLFVIDFASDTLSFIEWKLRNGKRYRCTYSETIEKELDQIRCQIEKCFGQSIVDEKIINPLNWSEEMIKEEIDYLSEWFNNVIDKNKIILVNMFYPFQRIKNSMFVNEDKPKEIAYHNSWIDFCSQYFAENVKCKKIEKINKLYYNEDGMYPDVFYRFLTDSLNAIASGQYDENAAMKSCVSQLDSDIGQYNLEYLLKTNTIITNNRELVLLGDANMLYNVLEGSKKIHCIIDYNYGIDIDEVIENVLRTKDCGLEFLYLVPNVYHDELVRRLWEIGIYEGKNLILPNHQIISLRAFRGEYIDVYNNYINTERVINIDISGSGAYADIKNVSRPDDKISINLSNQVYIKIEKDVWADKLSLGTLSGCKVIIGTGTTFADYCFLRMQPHMSVEIGADCMFSSKVYVYCGDGHGIYSIESEKKQNHLPELINTPKSKIVLGKHVWVGYQVVLLAGTHLGDGSIVGARSVVNKKFSNNCIIAGNAARMIRKDVAWTRNPFTTDLYNSQLMQNELRCVEYTKIEEEGI